MGSPNPDRAPCFWVVEPEAVETESKGSICSKQHMTMLLIFWCEPPYWPCPVPHGSGCQSMRQSKQKAETKAVPYAPQILCFFNAARKSPSWTGPDY